MHEIHCTDVCFFSRTSRRLKVAQLDNADSKFIIKRCDNLLYHHYLSSEEVKHCTSWSFLSKCSEYTSCAYSLLQLIWFEVTGRTSLQPYGAHWCQQASNLMAIFCFHLHKTPILIYCTYLENISMVASTAFVRRENSCIWNSKNVF